MDRAALLQRGKEALQQLWSPIPLMFVSDVEQAMALGPEGKIVFVTTDNKMTTQESSNFAELIVIARLNRMVRPMAISARALIDRAFARSGKVTLVQVHEQIRAQLPIIRNDDPLRIALDLKRDDVVATDPNDIMTARRVV